MAESFFNSSTVISSNSNKGVVRVADDVIAAIAGIAATEVEGVDSLAGDISNELVEKLGVRDLSKGIKITIDGSNVRVEASLIVKSTASLIEVSEAVQDKVKSTIESMTGLSCNGVDVRIMGVAVV